MVYGFKEAFVCTDPMVRGVIAFVLRKLGFEKVAKAAYIDVK